MTSPLPYRAFWHLEAIGVLQPTPGEGGLTHYTSPLWDMLYTGSDPALVVLIDTGVDVAHPYLVEAVRGQVDLTAMPAPRAPSDTAPSPFAALTAAHVEALGIEGLSAADEDWLERTRSAAEAGVPFDRGAPDTANRLFSSHGTSCAGLVAAATPTEASAVGPEPLAYCGVDPWAAVFSITTTFAPRPETLVVAFLLAAAQGADVILLPRGIALDEAPDPAASSAARPTTVLREVILAVSRRIPIVCAAGNDGASRLIEPAAMSHPDNGIVAVGAMSFSGRRASYSSYGGGLTLVAPSDDGEMFTRDQMRLDRNEPSFAHHPFEALASIAGVGEEPLAAQSILAIDTPGDFGFAAAGGPAASGSLSAAAGAFTLFGGTSAAASIVAGVAALVQRAAKQTGAALTGPEMSAVLVGTALGESVALPHHPAVVLTPDRINDGLPSFEALFGAGLVNAPAAVARVFELRGDASSS